MGDRLKASFGHPGQHSIDNDSVAAMPQANDGDGTR